MGNLLVSKEETVDMGVQYQMPRNIPPEKIWATMVNKVYKPEKFLPVNDVKTKDIIPGLRAYREMNFLGMAMKEDVYFDKPNFKIRFEVIDADEVHVNEYNPNTGVMEYYQENKKGERIPWLAPKTFVLNAMEQAKETAGDL